LEFYGTPTQSSVIWKWKLGFYGRPTQVVLYGAN
jgi:hypothetical protein